MQSIRKSLIALIGLLILVFGIASITPLVGSVQKGNPLTKDSRRLYYLTNTRHAGSEALSACAESYHMASFWEIFHFSTLKYNTELGKTATDSGFGPPAALIGTGWVRTGLGDDTFVAAGFSNCNIWTSANPDDFGSTAHLFLGDVSGSAKVVEPWVVGVITCSSLVAVWCVQD